MVDLLIMLHTKYCVASPPTLRNPTVIGLHAEPCSTTGAWHDTADRDPSFHRRVVCDPLEIFLGHLAWHELSSPFCLLEMERNLLVPIHLP